MSDSYKKGHEKGRSDAAAGKNRDMRPKLLEAVVKGTTYTNTFIEGYKEGYRQEKKK